VAAFGDADAYQYLSESTIASAIAASMSAAQSARPEPEGNPSQHRIQQNLAKSSQARPKESKGININFLVRIEPFQGLAPTPQGIFSFSSLCPAAAPRRAGSRQRQKPEYARPPQNPRMRVEPTLGRGTLLVYHVWLV
jgi:hypothetical protein